MQSWQENLELIANVNSGDRGAFNELVLQYTGYIEGVVSRELGAELRQRTAVEDLTQETFLRAFRSIGQFRGQSEISFRHWLGTIARRVVQGEARRLCGKAGLGRAVSLEGRTGPDGEASEALSAFLTAKGLTPSKVMGANQRFERLEGAMKRLSPDHRRVIRLARLQGLTITEVARRMERSEKATSVLLVRAMLKLRAAFGRTTSFCMPQRNLDEALGNDEDDG